MAEAWTPTIPCYLPYLPPLATPKAAAAAAAAGAAAAAAKGLPASAFCAYGSNSGGPSTGSSTPICFAGAPAGAPPAGGPPAGAPLAKGAPAGGPLQGGPLGAPTESSPLAAPGGAPAAGLAGRLRKGLGFEGLGFEGLGFSVLGVREYLLRTEKDLEQGPSSSSSSSSSNGISLLSVTIRGPFDAAKVAALAYSFFPFFFFIFVAGAAACTFKTLPLFSAGLQVLLTAANEQLLKRVYREPRPAQSLSKSEGMPSSHCFVSYAFLAWCCCEAAAAAAAPAAARLLLGALALAAWGPLPWARCHLKDHRGLQCLVGCLLGALVGICVFVFVHLALPSAKIL